MPALFRRISDDEFAAGYGLIVERTAWLKEQGIQQWPAPIPEAVICNRQAAGEFYGYWVDDELMAVACLLEKSVADWGDRLQGKYRYLATLASRLSHAGQGHGGACVLQACEHARQAGCGKVYLDCIDNAGALPRFYARLGFTPVDEQRLTNGWKDVLMARDLTEDTQLQEF